MNQNEQWVSDDTQPLNLEQLMFDERPASKAPLEVPARLKAPEKTGKSPAFQNAVDQYVWTMSKKRWKAHLSPQDELEMSLYLEHAEIALASTEKRIVVIGITGSERDRSPVLLNTWLALLNQGNVAIVEDEERDGMMTTRLVVIR